MEPEDLPDAEELWWSWVTLAALAAAQGDESCGWTEELHTLRLDTGDAWLRMQRPHAARAVLWGKSASAPAYPADPRPGAPDWALTRATQGRRPSFVAWHAHGEWDLSSPSDDHGVLPLLRPLLTVDPRAVALVRRGGAGAGELGTHLDGDDLDAAVSLVDAVHEDRAARPSDSVRQRLLTQVHEHMRGSEEVDRVLLQRPPLLVQWARVQVPGIPVDYAVLARRSRLVPLPSNTPLPTLAETSLLNVLQRLHQDETREDSGAWLFARVTSDGVVVAYDRAFDSWPAWYRTLDQDDGPTLPDLAWEMSQRDPAWRPRWASLLPHA